MVSSDTPMGYFALSSAKSVPLLLIGMSVNLDGIQLCGTGLPFLYPMSMADISNYSTMPILLLNPGLACTMEVICNTCLKLCLKQGSVHLACFSNREYMCRWSILEKVNLKTHLCPNEHFVNTFCVSNSGVRGVQVMRGIPVRCAEASYVHKFNATLIKICTRE